MATSRELQLARDAILGELKEKIDLLIEKVNKLEEAINEGKDKQKAKKNNGSK